MNLKNFILSLCAWAILPGGMALCTPVLAADSSNIRAVRVEGSQRIEPDTVRSYLKLDVGHPFEAEAIRKSLDALFATGFFKDVTVEREGDNLLVRVVENPMINEITYEGNDAFSAEELKKAVTLKANDIYDRAKTERDLAALRQAYRIKGLFLAKIDMLVKPIDSNRVNLVYRIEEGKKSKVQEVRIIGNRGLTDKKLMKKLLIQPSDWLSWYTETDTYDREKLMFDQTQLRNAYLDNGYARVRVDSSVAELTPDRGAFLVTHTVNEGNRFKFGTVRIVGDFDELPEGDLYKALKVARDDWFSQQKIRDSIDALTDLIGDFGYAFLDIKPEHIVQDDAGAVDLLFRISKGRRVYVNRIEVAGNTRTQDNVVRREILLVEGDRFSASRLRNGKRRLQNLDFFETIEITTPQAGEDELVDVKVKVTEKPTGTFTIGGGYSSQDAFIATASVSQNNFLGKGQRVIFSFALSGKRTEYNVSFTEPYFMDKPLSAGFDVFRRDIDQSTISSIKEKSFGTTLRLGFPISENMGDTVSYHIANTEIHYTGVGTPSRIIQVQEQLSPYLQSMVSNALTWNSVNNRLMPTDGRIHRLTTDLSGLGGDVQFARLVTDHHLYRSLSTDSDWVGHLRGRAGIADGMGKTVPIFERFFLGGSSSLRGFMPSGIGPRTVEDDAYGGMHFEQINTELFFPISGMTEKGVRGLLFVDAGYLGDFDLPSDIRNSDKIRMATGVGVHWNSPLGPLRFTLATPLMKETYDHTRIFDFSIGTTM